MPPARLFAGCPAAPGRGLGFLFGACLAIFALSGIATAQSQDLSPGATGGQAEAGLLQPAGVPPIDVESDEILQIDSTGQLAELMDETDFSLEAVREAKQPVPRLFVAELPSDLNRKDLFLAALLPLILHVNEAIQHDRDRVTELQQMVRNGEYLTVADRLWLGNLCERYKVDGMNFADLLERVDIIPPSMALAQAAVETGWGTSTLARSRNALFGQMTLTSSYSNRQYVHFDQLRDSAQAYADNLNTNPAYASFRQLRAAARAAGQDPSGYQLLAGMDRYSELGQGYISFVRGVIDSNDLGSFDHARLARPGHAYAASAT